MPLDRFINDLRSQIAELESTGTAKGAEHVVTEVIRASNSRDTVTRSLCA